MFPLCHSPHEVCERKWPEFENIFICYTVSLYIAVSKISFSYLYTQTNLNKQRVSVQRYYFLFNITFLWWLYCIYWWYPACLMMHSYFINPAAMLLILSFHCVICANSKQHKCSNFRANLTGNCTEASKNI